MDAFPLLNGLYALDEDVRMMLYSWIDESYRLEGDTMDCVWRASPSPATAISLLP